LEPKKEPAEEEVEEEGEEVEGEAKLEAVKPTKGQRGRKRKSAVVAAPPVEAEMKAAEQVKQEKSESAAAALGDPAGRPLVKQEATISVPVRTELKKVGSKNIFFSFMVSNPNSGWF
jgi:hypothetical protein